MLASYLDQQNDPRPTTAGRGARVGLMAGIIGACIWLVVTIALDAVLAPLRERILSEVVRIARDMPPEAREALESLSEASPGGHALDFVLLLCGGAIFSTLGGVLGASFFRNDVPPALGGSVEPPPIP